MCKEYICMIGAYIKLTLCMLCSGPIPMLQANTKRLYIVFVTLHKKARQVCTKMILFIHLAQSNKGNSYSP